MVNKKSVAAGFSLRFLCVLFLIFIISGCALYTKPKVPTLKVPATFKNANKFTSNKVKERWWQNFNDKKLNQLVNLALQNNLNYQIALKNIIIARTYVTQNASYLFPQENLNLGTSRNVISKNTTSLYPTSLYNLYQLNGTVSYELDVWGRIRNSLKQASTNVNVSIADSNIIKLAIIDNIVASYIQITVLNANLDNLKKQYNSAIESTRLNQDQYKGGLVDIEPIDDAKTQVENIKSTISSLEKQRQILINTIAYLVGTYPESFNFKIEGRIQNLDFNKIIPAGIPSQILINRPDIQSSFYQIISYSYAQKQSLAAFFPTFSLTGALGFASIALGNFTTGNSKLWNLGAGTTQTLFDFGKTYSQYKRARLQYESSILTYENTVLNAFTEVNNALVSYQQDYLALNASQRMVWLAKDKLDLANAQYKSGIINYISYIDYKLTFLQSQYILNNQIQTLIGDVIQIYKTLGMGLT